LNSMFDFGDRQENGKLFLDPNTGQPAGNGGGDGRWWDTAIRR